MKDFLLFPLPLSEFELLVENTVKRVFVTNVTQSNPSEIINRDELCRRLNITEPTAIRWEKKGKLPSIRIGSNVRYNWPVVIEELEKKGGR